MAAQRDTGAGIGDYLKEAFLFRWNLLLFAGAAAAALISPYPDIALPLVAAGEMVYLAGLTSIPRFRSAIDAKVHAASKAGAPQTAPPKVAYGDLLAGLRPEARARFHKLRLRCLEMRGIAQGVSGKAAGSARTDEIRIPALNRMLWVFVRLLSSQQALKRFLETTDADEIKRSLDALKARRDATAADDDRLLKSIIDSIETAELRLSNYQRSEKNAAFVDVELDRIESKIQALTEMAINNQDPDYISGQVDSVAESMAHTEDAIRQMQHITGLSDELAEAPAILEVEELEVAG